MSAAFKLSKQKPSQQDLRRLMQEQKQQRSSESGVDKIDSPFAKFENGQLNCVLCKSVVRSAAVWKVHINSKQHKENLHIAKQLKEKLEKQSKPETPEERLAKLKRNAEVLRSDSADSEIPEKKVKGILKNSSGTSEYQPTSKILLKSSIKTEETTQPQALQNSNQLPSDFFDGNSENSGNSLNSKPKSEIDLTAVENEKTDDVLPEGFFDDPVKDAKVRHQEYKDPTEAEWEKFQKEIKEAEVESTNIINVDYEDEIVERQIEEIDVQMRNWSK
jgi:zinc finger protein 830